MAGIYFLQVMALCVLLVKGFAFAALIIPLIVFTAVVHSNCTKLFRRPWTLMSTKEAAILDTRDPVSVALCVHLLWHVPACGFVLVAVRRDSACVAVVHVAGMCGGWLWGAGGWCCACD
jgi:hypothetical protein